MLASILLIAALADTVPGAAQRTAEAMRLDPQESVQLDGRLDEEVWRRSLPIGAFVQQEPREGAVPSERSEIRIAYDEDNLYIGAMMYDSDPSGILAHQRARDAGLGTDDRFMWILDTFRDGRTGYFFEINPAGLMGDGLIRASGGVNKAWDGIWSVRMDRSEEGWSAEIEIPFRTLNFNPASDSWGINFQRTVRRRNEEILWSGFRRNEGLFNPGSAGVLTGLRGISQGLGLEVKPYALASAREVDAEDGWDIPADVGFDVNYSITPGLRASLSVNTDFAEAEVDQRQVNLTRFPLRFPEQRDFFLEGSGVFSFSPSNGVDPYFSRRIGLVGGQPVPIRYGGRVAGQAGAYDLALLQVRTGGLDALPAEQFTAARVVRSLFRQSSVGVIYTRRAPDGTPEIDDAHTIGADLELFTSRFMGDQNLRFQACLVGHNEPLPAAATSWGDRSARGVRLTYPNDVWSGHVSYRELGDAFDPAVGFTPRRGFRRVQPTVDFRPRPAWLPGVRQLEFRVEGEYLTDLSNRLQTRRLGLGALGVVFDTGDRVGLDWDSNYEWLEREFRLHPDTALDAVIRPGGYTFGGWQLSGSTAGRRAISGGLNLATGSFWSGDRLTGSGRVTVRPAPGLSAFSEFERNRIQLPGTDFSTDLLRVGGGWHASTFTSVTGSVQYDNISDAAGLYGRLHWILRPGSDLYLVYTHNWNEFAGDWLSGQRGMTSKISYTHRF